MSIISAAELVAALFKATKETSGNIDTILAVEYAFGAPKKSVEFYEADDSGMLPNPIPNCKTKPEDRISHITNKMITTFLSGPNLTPTTTRFQESLTKKVSEPGVIGYQWVGIPDLYASFRSRSWKLQFELSWENTSHLSTLPLSKASGSTIVVCEACSCALRDG
jgi:hypothetical protein